MSLAMNDNDRYKPRVNATVDIDPASATILLLIDGTEHPCSWLDDAVRTGAGTTTDPYVWTRTAVTNGYLAGPAVPDAQVDGATVLTYGSHTLEVVVTTGPTIKSTQLLPFNISR
jgi:hypothetical protein